MKQISIDYRDRRLVENLYVKQTIIVRVNSTMSERCIIGQGIRISSQLFSLFSEKMMVEAFEESDLGFKVGGRKVRDVRFVDDQAMITNDEDEL